MKVNPNKFWDDKILKWEKDKYSKRRYDVNSSVKVRLQIARSILRKYSAGKIVIELGCGSGLLAEDIMSFGAKKYIGFDISSVAIDAAKKRLMNSPYKENVEFNTSDVQNLPNLNSDICFSLGLFDWLELSDIADLKNKVTSNYFFHSFSEKKPFSIQQRLHQIYVFLMYGHKTQEYVPKYFTDTQVADTLLEPNKKLEFLRPQGMSFGSFVYSLPDSLKDLS